MKYTVAWAKIVSENSILKTVVLCLTGLTVFFGLSALKLALKDPIVVDRGCFSKVANVGDSKRTNLEIESFLKEALAQRFDTTAQVHDNYLATDEQFVRQKEQKDLQSRKLIQRIVLNSASVYGGEVAVDSDRLISVGDVRSAFKFPLKVKIESVSRSEGNPYGLVVTEVKAIEKEEKR
jgi:hypothetical protein